MFSYAQADLRLQGAQLGQLHQLNYQLRAQQTEANNQRYLSDVLLAVTQGVDRVERTGESDVLAAGVLAHRWLQTTHWVHAGLFSDFERKRTFEHCRTVLVAARDRLWMGGPDVDVANAYLRLEDRLAELTTMLGNNPNNAVAVAASHVNSGQLRTRFYDIGAATVAGLGLLLSLPLLLDGDGGLTFVLWFFVGLVVCVLGFLSLQSRSQGQRAAANYSRLVALRAELERLGTAEDGVRWLQKVRAEHPLLLQAPAADTRKKEASEVVERHTIERQVVVARCKFCGQLTPVDQPRCANCGGDKPL